MQRNAKYLQKLVSETDFKKPSLKGPCEKHWRFKGPGLGNGGMRWSRRRVCNANRNGSRNTARKGEL